jgi:hypothetical protein
MVSLHFHAPGAESGHRFLNVGECATVNPYAVGPGQAGRYYRNAAENAGRFVDSAPGRRGALSEC